jgi:hypothetical protein
MSIWSPDGRATATSAGPPPEQNRSTMLRSCARSAGSATKRRCRMNRCRPDRPMSSAPRDIDGGCRQICSSSAG